MPWRNIARMRDKLIHHYFDVDLDVVWCAIESDLPPFYSRIQLILNTPRHTATR